LFFGRVLSTLESKLSSMIDKTEEWEEMINAADTVNTILTSMQILNKVCEGKK